jgi:hypothetical protein
MIWRSLLSHSQPFAPRYLCRNSANAAQRRHTAERLTTKDLFRVSRATLCTRSRSVCVCYIHKAAEEGDIDAIAKAMEQCSCLDARDKQERTPLHLASMNNHGMVNTSDFSIFYAPHPQTGEQENPYACR